MDPDFRLIAIPPARVLLAEDAVDQCRAAARGGATSIQVRLKHHSASDIIRIVESIRQAVSVPVYVNDRVDVAAAANADGVHLGADDLPSAAIDRVVPAGIRIGLSVGTPMEAQRARAVRRAHYWSLGPFAATTQKADAGSPLGADGFQRLAALAPRDMPIVAIGGITPAFAAQAVAAGAHGVAAISAVFDAVDVEAATRRLRDAVDR